MIVTDDEHVFTERVGRFNMAVRCAQDPPEARQRWDRRVDALTAWLLNEWRREHAEAN